MTLVLAFIAAHIGTVLAGAGGLVAIIAAWFHGKSTGTAQAASQVKVAQTEVQVAQMSEADAKANAEQAKAETIAVKVAAQAQADAATMTDPQLDDAAAKLGILKE